VPNVTGVPSPQLIVALKSPATLLMSVSVKLAVAVPSQVFGLMTTVAALAVMTSASATVAFSRNIAPTPAALSASIWPVRVFVGVRAAK